MKVTITANSKKKKLQFHKILSLNKDPDICLCYYMW